ncbi:Fc.00g042260.m01.CDS01 [Cosmosporella sp. VM-42]
MTDRYRGYTPSGRSNTFNNPARTSLPSSIGYTSLYAGDMHVMPPSTRHQPTTAPRGYATSTTPSGIPTTTRTYAVTQDPRSMRPTTRDVGRHRSSTLDSTHRPPVIVMTTQGKDRAHAASSHSSNNRSGSPIRDEYRSSEGQFYTQPASSIRSRSSARQFSDQLDSDEYARIRERSDNLLRDDAYRSSRPSVIYPTNPRHSAAPIDYGDEGYQYTNAGELARYDLDHTAPSRSKRRESVDRGYYRPNINYNADQRSLNVNTSPDLGRNYNMNTSRPYENRGGPPPTTRGFDKISREYYDTSRDVPPAAPAPPDPTPVAQVEIAGVVAEGRRPRPVSLYQEGPPRSTHHDDLYRSREDERNMRELRDREPQHESDRAYDGPYFHDDRVTTRGFGIRTDLVDDFDDRRDRRRDSYVPDEPKKRSDEELPRESELDRETRRRSRRESKDGRRERRESKRGSDEDEKERSRFRDKMAAGLGIAATAMGLAPPAPKDDDKREKEREPRRRRGSDEDRDRRKDPEGYDRLRASDRSRSRHRDYDRRDTKDELEPKERKRRDTDSRKTGEAVISASDSDEGKKSTRRNRNSNVFNPNDASDLKQLKEQLASMKISDKEREKEKPVVIETTRTRSSSPVRESKSAKEVKPTSTSTKETNPILKEPQSTRDSPRDYDQSPPPRDETRGREATIPAPEEKENKQVRVVSPPRDKKDEKPIKGILKQPKVKFPEEPNPIREGVAPHKEDKKLKEAPAGAKWTKISRKVVNPEALTIGKERFEVRDDFVIVLRVLSTEEIQAYAAATQVLRERRRRDEDGDRDYDNERERERDRERDRDRDRDRDDDDKRKHHRHRHHRDDDDEDRDDKDRDRERRRRHRDDDDYDARPRELDHDHHHHYRSHREREPVLEV